MVGQKKSEGKKPARKWSCTMRGPVSRLPGKARRPALCLAATRITEGCAQKSVSQRVVCAGEETSRYATESEQPMQHIETQCKWCCGLITHTHTHTRNNPREEACVRREPGSRGERAWSRTAADRATEWSRAASAPQPGCIPWQG